MAESDKDRTKVEAAPESTWGATPEAKVAWEKKYGKAAEKAAADRAHEDKDK